MIDKKIENFLEKTDMNYLFCLLSKLEAGRLSQLPVYVRNKLGEKLSVLSMQHVSDNEIPDYISEIAEAELAMAQAQSPFDLDDGSDSDLGEETYDDSLRLTDEPEPEPVNPFDVVDDDDDEDIFGDQDDLDEADDDD
jgi:hypothetical protein